MGFFWKILGAIGITRQDDLPALPIQPAGTPKNNRTPNSARNRVTFSPNQEFIPQYQFDKLGQQGPNTPSKLNIELRNVSPMDMNGDLQELLELGKQVEDLRDEIADLEQEHSRLLNENKLLRAELPAE